LSSTKIISSYGRNLRIFHVISVDCDRQNRQAVLTLFHFTNCELLDGTPLPFDSVEQPMPSLNFGAIQERFENVWNKDFCILFLFPVRPYRWRPTESDGGQKVMAAVIC
jgi:hypothetical protein